MSNKRRCFLCIDRKVSPKNTPIAFHRFPTNKEVRSMWMKVCNLNEAVDDVSSKYVAICSNHFTAEDYIDINAKKFGGQLKLKFGAVPSVGVLNEITPVNLKQAPEEPEIFLHNPHTDVSPIEVWIGAEEQENKIFTGGKDEDIKEADVSTPERAKKCLDLAMSTIEQHKKTIKALNEKNRRLTKQIRLLQNLIKQEKRT